MSNLIPQISPNIPTEKEADWTTYMASRTYKPLRPGQISYWQNYPKFMVSFKEGHVGGCGHRRKTTGPIITCPSWTCPAMTSCACST